VYLAGVRAMGVHPIGIYLTGLHLTGMHLMSVHRIGMYPIGTYLISVDVTGIYFFKGVHLLGMHLLGVHLMGVHLIGVASYGHTYLMSVDLSGRNCYPDTPPVPTPTYHCVGWHVVVCYGGPEWFRFILLGIEIVGVFPRPRLSRR
jgi:hypothetical protein